MPIMSNNCFMAYDKKKILVTNDYKISKLVYDLNIYNYACVVGIYLFAFVSVFCYGKLKNIKYFKRHKMNKLPLYY